MTTPTAAREHGDDYNSPFTGADVCELAGLALPEFADRPEFADDLWNFTEVIGLPVKLPLANRRFGFTGISDPRWRLVAKELIMAMLAPQHPAVAPLTRAYRTPLHLSSYSGRLHELTRFFIWLDRRNITSLRVIDTHLCEAYLHFRRYVIDDDGTVVGEQSPAVRRAAAQAVVDLVNYRDLFTADRVSADLRPWGGATASAVAEMPNGRAGNTTPAIADEILQPLLTAALHLVETLGPHAAGLNEEIRRTESVSSQIKAGLRHSDPARTLSLEMGYRPGGVLASKIHMKHCVVATTEGYLSKPGGAPGRTTGRGQQARSRPQPRTGPCRVPNYQSGVLPAGPGARSLTEFFASIDTDLNTESVAAPKLQRNDRDILNLLSKRAKVLHLGPANYCWFTDPSRALIGPC